MDLNTTGGVNNIPPTEYAVNIVQEVYSQHLQNLFVLRPDDYLQIVKGLTAITYVNFYNISNMVEIERIYDQICGNDISKTIMEVAILRLYSYHWNIDAVITAVTNLMDNNKSAFLVDTSVTSDFKWHGLVSSEPWMLVCLLIKLGKPFAFTNEGETGTNDGNQHQQ